MNICDIKELKAIDQIESVERNFYIFQITLAYFASLFDSR